MKKVKNIDTFIQKNRQILYILQVFEKKQKKMDGQVFKKAGQTLFMDGIVLFTVHCCITIVQCTTVAKPKMKKIRLEFGSTAIFCRLFRNLMIHFGEIQDYSTVYDLWFATE